MDSLNDQIWTDEDENTVEITGNILSYRACLVSCEMGGTGHCGGSGSGPYGTTSNIDELCTSC